MTTRNINFPQILAALYFSICTFGFNLIAKYFLMIYNMSNFLPFLASSVLAIILGAFFGGLFSKYFISATKLLSVFAWGVLLAVVIILFFSLGLQLIYYFHNHVFYQNLHHWQDYLVLYGVLLSSVFFIAGIWFIPFMGIVAIFFKRNFLPKCMNYLSI